MSTNKNHSEQFERYLKGQMSHQEAHAFEREVLGDPFAQEALEGFESQGVQAIDDLKKLRRDILSEKKRLSFMRIAAVVSLLVVGSFTVYFFTSQLENEKLVMEEESIEKITQSDLAPDTIPIANNAKPKVTEAIPVAEKKATETESRDALKVENRQDKVMQLAESDSDEALEEIVFEDTSAGEVLIAEGSPVLQMRGVSSGASTQTHDFAPEQDLIDTAQLEEVVITAQPLVAKREVLQNSINAISADDTEKEKKPTSRAAARSRSADHQGYFAMSGSATPIIGFDAYKQYLSDSLRYPNTALANRIEGVVEVEITLDSAGTITNKKIIKSLGYGCDEEAIRLISEGSEWQPAIRNDRAVVDKVVVKINFNL